MTARAAARSEAAVPELSPLTDGCVMRPVLATLETSLLAGWHLNEVEVVAVRHRTYDDPARRSKSSVLVTYRLSLQSTDRQRTRELELYVRAFLDPFRLKRFLDGAPFAVPLPELNACAWLLAGDPALPDLAPLLDSATALDQLPAGVGPVAGVSTAPLRYKPGDRCTLRVDVDRAETADSTGRPLASRTLVAKVLSSIDRAATLDRYAAELWRRSHQPEAQFAVPEPLSAGTGRATRWQTWLPGMNPRRADLDPAMIHRLAVALASFHRTPMIAAPRRTMSDELAQTERKAVNLARFDPALGPGLHRLIRHLDHELSHFDAHPPAVVHGALRLRQLLVSDTTVGFLDFDSVAIGDPLSDITDLLLDIDPDLGPGWTNPAVNEFIAAYEAESGMAIEVERVRWYLPIHRLKRAHWLRTSAAWRAGTAAELRKRVHAACDQVTPTSKRAEQGSH